MTGAMRLTAKRKARFPEFVEKWTRIGLCTDPVDRVKAEEGVRLAYRTAGLKPPGKIIWCGSPLAMGRACRKRLRAASFQDSVWNSVWGSIWGLVSHSVQPLVWESAGDTLWASVEDAVRAAVHASVRVSVWYVVREELNGLSVRDMVYGQYDAGWYALFEYFRIVCGLSQETEKMLGLMQVAENAGCWSPYEDICWICERPNRLTRDDRGRLHCEDGPAITYPNGWSVYAIHGVRVDKQVVISPMSQDVDKIRKERNAEVRRVRIERFGWPEYLRAVRARVLDTRDNDVEATKEALMRTPDGQVVIVCSCPSTARVYCLEVPPDIMTCEDAQDWLSGGLSARVINGA